MSQPPPSWQPPPPEGQPIANYPPPEAYQYTQPPTYPPQQFTPRRDTKSKGERPWLVPTVVGVVALLIGVGLGAATKSSPTKTAADTSSVKATTTVTARTTITATTTATATPAASATTTAAAPPPAAPAAKTVLTLSGNGIKNSPNFIVTQSQWTIAYSYDCTSFGSRGNFIVTINDSSGKTDFAKSGVNELAAKGNSSTVEHGAGTYSLSINSECNWNVAVTG